MKYMKCQKFQHSLTSSHRLMSFCFLLRRSWLIFEINLSLQPIQMGAISPAKALKSGLLASFVFFHSVNLTLIINLVYI